MTDDDRQCCAVDLIKTMLELREGGRDRVRRERRVPEMVNKHNNDLRPKMQYLVLSDLTDHVSSLNESALRCEGLAERARMLSSSGFDLADVQHAPDALAVVGGDDGLADEVGLPE